MAEQVGHHVVNESESTSASALVDVAANQTAAASAETGIDDINPTSSLISNPKSAVPDATLAANEYAVQSNILTSSISPGNDGAGETVEEVAAATPRIALNTPAAETSLTVNGADDTAVVTDGLADDVSIREGSVDISLNSDTEGSRGDSSELKKDETHHVRTNSVKKPITFSKVSVTKNFLAKSATTVAPVAKPGDRPGPAGTPPQLSAAKPRLIAKVGTSLRDVQKSRLSADTTIGPDASKVWNKNRPVPPPPPKQFTDEELKQQYGIHLATRLQTDEEGKQSKWADIDDDEEDWAPDTVEWMDGTKSTLVASETQQPPSKDQTLPSVPSTKPVEPVRPTLIVKKPTELGASMTVLKPGANAAAAQARQGDYGTGTGSDKTSDAARGAATLPTKSPWAMIPPVDKVSPINPPVQQRQPSSFATQDARMLEPAPALLPAREIAADTFDRSWREGEGGTRELFNSTNGRYEPVQEGRRGSNKLESGYRKPSVLRRPSQNGPAEPSAAFQTRTASQHDSPWNRRRGSSVSQNNPSQARRMSTPRTSEASPAAERRPSTSDHDLRASPQAARNELAQPTFSQTSAWDLQMPPQPEAGTAEEDPVKVQERVMREKREEARKRHEEEARLEAEKNERLKAKLASLAGAGKSRKEREAEAAAAATATTVDSTDDGRGNATLPSLPIEHAMNGVEQAKPSALPVPAVESSAVSPPLETVPSTQPQQEGPQPLSIPSPQVTAGLPERAGSSADQAQRQAPRTHLSPAASSRIPFQQPGASFKATPSAYSSPGDRKQQPFERSPLANSSAFTPWPTTAPSGSVWGTTSGIGNGTFESSNVFAPMPMSQQSSLPPPPGMTRQSGSNRISPQSLASESRSPSLQQQSVAEPSRAFAPPGMDSRADAFANQGRVSGASPAPGLGRQTHLPGPIAPPSRVQQPGTQQSSAHQASLAAWNNAAHALPQQHKADVETAEQRAKEAVPAPRNDTFRETFRQTTGDQTRLGGPRRYAKAEYTIHDGQGSRSVQSLSPAPPVAQTQPPPPSASPMAHDPWMSAGEHTVRLPDGSMNPAHGGAHSRLSPIKPPSSQQSLSSAARGNATYSATQDAQDQSPPPPETSTHPVHSGDGNHPHVRLPPNKPTVKLPPAHVSSLPHMPQQTPVLPHRASPNWGPPGSSKPLVMQEAWQARFNGLFNRTPISTETPPSPPKTPPKMQGPALAVASSSRVVMDYVSVSPSATVSLPPGKRVRSIEGFTIDDTADVVSKPAIEDMFMEELSFGSLPQIHIPKGARYVRSPSFARHSISSLPMHAEADSRLEFNMSEVHTKRPDGFFVHLPSTKLVRRFIKRRMNNRRLSGMHQERKTSGRFMGKAQDGSPHTASASTSARKTSVQKGRVAASSSPSAGVNKTERKPSGPRVSKGRGRGSAPTAQAAPAA